MTFRRGIPAQALALALAAGAPLSAQTAPPPMTAEQQADWPMIGRVNVSGIGARSMCSGTLVAADMVLTAAHCLRQPGNGALPDPADVTFGAGWRQGDYLAAGAAVELILHPTLSGRPPLSLDPNNLGADIALIRLGDMMAPAIPPLSLAPLPDRPADLRVIGYRGDRPHIPTDVHACEVAGRAPGAFAMNCALTNGLSGAPVLAKTGAGWQVVGVVSASLSGEGPRSLAVRADSWAAVWLARVAATPATD